MSRGQSTIAVAVALLTTACTASNATTTETVPFVTVVPTVPTTETPAPTRTLPVSSATTTQPAAPVASLSARGPVELAAFDAVLEETLQRKGAIGASVAVARGGKLVYARAYGSRDRTTGAPVELGSRFDLASLSKVFVAAAVMRLVDEGRLHLDDKLLDVVGDRLVLPPSHDPRLADTTIRQLLGHTSGIREHPDMGPVGATSCDDTIDHALQRGMSVAPGTFLYSNVNYCLLGRVVEAVLDEPWETAVHELVLDPAGAAHVQLAHTGYVSPGDVDHVAGLGPTGDNPTYLEALGPAAQWAGSAADVVRVLDALDPEQNDGARLISAAALATMTARPATATATDVVDDGTAGSIDPTVTTSTAMSIAERWYGLGLMAWDGGASWGHSGSLPMARNLAMHQADGTTWCILVYGSFDDHTDVLLRAMRTALSTVTEWPTADLGPAVP